MHVKMLIKILEMLDENKEVKLLDNESRDNLVSINYIGQDNKNIVLGSFEPVIPKLEKIGPF